MFGSLTHIIAPGRTSSAPLKEAPPPTPVNFPRCYPQVPADGSASCEPDRPPQHLTSVLRSILRPTDVKVSHLQALGTHVIPDSTIAELIPDPSFIPDFDTWDALSPDEAHTANDSTRRKTNTGSLTPGCSTFLDRKRELSIPNESAYRAIRRVPAPRGQPQARLGNSFEFYRQLELFAAYWDDTSKPASTPVVQSGENATSSPSPEVAGEGVKTESSEPPLAAFGRTSTGSQMPPDYRQNIVTAFLKMVAYDFGCNVSAPRTEPRLFIKSASTPQRTSYFSSGCTFIFRTPNTREAARAGIVEGPLAAVSARHTTTFLPARATDRDSTLDLARELIAALITAQHRTREGREEQRIGEGQWWTSKPRWGGGPGGPIGRELEAQSGADETTGDKDAPPAPPPALPTAAEKPSEPSSRARLMASLAGVSGPKPSKRAKRTGNLPMYDNYRMVRPPSAAWDKKTKYEAIGKVKGVGYDDVFVVSALFHHISVVRVRVPDGLLAVLEGAPDEGRSWGQLEVRRSRWFDLFLVEDRVEAMKLVWSMVNFLMREEKEGESAKGGGDVEMSGV
ncbi:hypothetical protein B0T18DRAFT_437637 [Schizothecium vesticola]|uniref:Uncharacterized protein n=1 Tax=Schizothecium vesticola TaxID=314040 RepID=A0AA40F3C2_9PEZI|nr:hypothetical protein B0T18DRAFT_437637 [Schizothecium vesticola]